MPDLTPDPQIPFPIPDPSYVDAVQAAPFGQDATNVTYLFQPSRPIPPPVRKPGDVITHRDGRRYQVAKNGSFRRIG